MVQIQVIALMCNKHTDDVEEVDEEDDAMTTEELHKKVREHMERRKEAYVKMGTVDKPRE